MPDKPSENRYSCYAICRNCDQILRDHAAPDNKCFLEATFFEPKMRSSLDAGITPALRIGEWH
jgi:hypothetical protein